MRLASEEINPVCDEQRIFESLVPDHACVLELGCGMAEKTRLIANGGKAASILALEVDQLQHAENMKLSDLPQVRFGFGGAENIPAGDAVFDLVMMFKSLHHVPVEKMDQALREIARVLKPGGLAYLSEPVFAGDYNELIRLFHDEEVVRAAAFDAVRRAVDAKRLALVKQIFFNTRIRFRDFAEFDRNVLNVTHTRHHLSAELYGAVRAKFEQRMTAAGAEFLVPIRVDLLRKSA